MSGYLETSTRKHKQPQDHAQCMEDPVVPVERHHVRSCIGKTVMGKAIQESSVGILSRKKVPNR